MKMNPGDVEIKIIHEIKIEREDEDENEEENEEELVKPFPSPPKDALNKTDSSELTNNETGKSPNWKAVEKFTSDLDTKSSNSKWSSALRAIKRAPSSTRSFLGIDSHSHNGAKNTKTINNWRERQFKSLNNNLIFGGKLKTEQLRKYMDDLDETNADEADPFLYYKECHKCPEVKPKLGTGEIVGEIVDIMTLRVRKKEVICSESFTYLTCSNYFLLLQIYQEEKVKG